MISFVALATLLAWRGAEAYPRFWYDSDYLIAYGYGPDAGYDWSVFPERNCFNYPTTAYTGFYPAHSSPYTDRWVGKPGVNAAMAAPMLLRAPGYGCGSSVGRAGARVPYPTA